MDGKGVALVMRTAAELIQKTRFKNILHLGAFLLLFTPTYATYKLLEDPEKFLTLIEQNEHNFYTLDIVNGCVTFKLTFNGEEKFGTYFTDEQKQPNYIIKFYPVQKSYPELEQLCTELKSVARPK